MSNRPCSRNRLREHACRDLFTACTPLRSGIPSTGNLEGSCRMTRLAWLTDIHLNFLRRAEQRAFFASLPDADAFAITGDIGEAHDVAAHLRAFAELGPLYFVLGNHDFYRGSIAGVRAEVRQLCCDVPNL